MKRRVFLKTPAVAAGILIYGNALEDDISWKDDERMLSVFNYHEKIQRIRAMSKDPSTQILTVSQYIKAVMDDEDMMWKEKGRVLDESATPIDYSALLALGDLRYTITLYRPEMEVSIQTISLSEAKGSQFSEIQGPSDTANDLVAILDDLKIRDPLYKDTQKFLKCVTIDGYCA